MTAFIKRLMFTAFIFGITIVPFSARVSAAPIDGGTCQGANLTIPNQYNPANGSAACDPNSPESNEAVSKVNGTVKLVINTLSWIVGVASVIMIIIGGFKYITSGGDSSKIASAKDTILFAIIGLVIAALAQIIVRFVLNRATTPPQPSATILRSTDLAERGSRFS